MQISRKAKNNLKLKHFYLQDIKKYYGNFLRTYFLLREASFDPGLISVLLSYEVCGNYIAYN